MSTRLVILGTGFGAFSVTKSIDVRRYGVTVVSRRNHFLFTPLLRGLFWRSAYLTRLLSLRTKAQVLFDWIKSQVFGRDISRF